MEITISSDVFGLVGGAKNTLVLYGVCLAYDTVAHCTSLTPIVHQVLFLHFFCKNNGH
jgi:hypothetical protein